MDNRVKILSDLRERLDNKGKNGAEGQQEIQEIFRSFLSDTADGSKKQSSHETKVVAILELLIKSAKTYPDSFLGGENTEKRESSFCIWIIHRLVLFLSNPSQTSLHQKSIEAIHALTMLLKYKQQKICILLVNILVPLLGDVHVLVKNSYDKKTTNKSQFPVTLHNFQMENVGSKDIDISIKNENEAFTLLRNLGELIYLILPDICQAFPTHYISLWKLFCAQAFWNDVSIKEVSLRCIARLLKWRPVPPEMVDVDSFRVIVACLKDIISQQKQQAWDKPKHESFQAALSSVITCSLQSSHQRKRVPNTCLDLLVNVIGQLSANYVCLTNCKLKLAIAEMISTICEQVQCDGFVATSDANFQACARQLVTLIGCHDDFQHMAKCFYHFIICDLLARRSQYSCPKRSRRQETADVMRLKIEKESQVDIQDGILLFLNKRFYFLWEKANNDLAKDVSQALDGVFVILRSYMMVLGSSTLFNDELLIIKQEMVVFFAHTVTSMVRIYDSLINHAKIRNTDEKDVMKLILCKIHQVIKALLFHGFQQILPPDLLTTLLAMVSLPWLVVVSTVYDGDVPCLPGWNMTKMRQLAGTITPLASLSDYYELLTLFPVDTWTRWRIHIFQLSLVKNFGGIQTTVIDCLPMLVSSTRENEHYEILDIVKHAQKDTIQAPLSKTFGDLTCALDGCVDLKEMVNFEDFPLKLRPFSCQFCQKSQNKGKPLKHAAFVREAMTLVLSGATAKTKLHLVVSFKQLSRHYDVPAEYCSYVVNECIALIEDPDYDVRVKFSKLLPCLTKQDVDITKTIVSKVKEVFTKVSAKKKTRLQETVVYTIGELGKEARDDLLLVVIISLLETFLSDTKVISSLAFTQILAVSKYKKKTTQEMFGDLKFHICKFMVEKAISEFDNATEDPEACLNVFGKVSRVFNFKNVKVLLQGTQSIIVPQLVKKATVQSSFVLRQLAKYLKVNYRKDLLLLNFNFIFSYLVRTCSGEELKEALAFVQRETDVDLGSLLKSDSQSVVNQLLLHLYSSYNKVFTGLTILASKDDSRVGDKDITSPEQMAEFLHPRLLGILAFFNTVLLDDKNIEEKYRALGSLVKLMEMMGPKHITVVRVKVMAILKIALHFDRADFRELCCAAWDCFVRCLDVTSLRSMLGHIVVTLTPLLAHCLHKVSRILHYLIVEKEEELRGSFKDIYFIPDYPELDQVNGVLRKSTREEAGSNLRVEVEQILKGVAHESQDVRHHAVTRLKSFLHEHQNELQEFITNKDEVDPVVTSLINKLIERCSEPVHSTQVKIGECLGELGAIDPGWLDKPRQNFNEDTAIYEMKCDSPTFAVDLLNELVRAFLAAADTRSQDCSAYAIQEVLQIYECSNQSSTSPGYKIWCQLPDHIQEVLKPHLHSKYVHSAQANRSKLSRPIYFSNNGKNFADWISTWALDLVNKVHQRKPLRLFKACSAVFKHDINTAIFLLPHIILYVAIDGTSTHHTEVHNEILAILKHVEERHDRTGLVYPQGVIDFSHISAQTIFSILDYLTRWSRLKADSNCKTQILASRSDKNNSCGAGNESDDGLQKVLQFLEGIPQNVLATASFHCKAYARSLMHFEQFIEKSQQDLQVHLNLIQQLYWALNEPDGVVGVAAVRKRPASLYEETLEHESAGKLRDAVACYERAIQLEPDRIENHKRLMSCWIVLGQVSTALEHANGVLTRRPSWTNSINSYRIEACWRLGQWDELESYAKLEGCCKDWSTGVGKILLAVKKKDKDSFSKCIFELRNTQMEPLSAASMESGSYQRGYDFIVKLHILHELEDSLSRVFSVEGSDHPDIDTMMINWTKRLAITRASFQAREPILSLRRVMLKLLSNDTSATNVENHCWLQSAKVARKAGHFQTAYSYLLNVSSLCNTTDCCLEQAKLLWAQGNCHQALLRLEKWLAEAKPVTDEKSKLTKSKILLFIARWMDETANYGPQPVLAQYKEVVSLNEKWENAHFYLAKYYDKIMNSFADTKKTGTLDFLPFVMKHYGDSLQFGNKFIYQSVPKILQFWLDFGANVPDQAKQGKSDRNAMQQRLAALNDIMTDLTDRLAPFQFFTAFSQLISRMCHRNEEVWERLMKLISKLLVTYPQQGIWSMVAVSKSTFALRKTRCQKIFQNARRADRKLGRFIEDACKLAQLLIEVSEKNRGKETVLSMTQDFGILRRLVSDDQFSSIIIPLQSSLTVALPSGHGEHQDHYPFPDSQPTFIGFEDKVEVLQSLARPKKIIARGSDGQSYILLCKPKDDLRKDSRTMEFNGLVNKCLRKDPECRRRQLHIRTYAVVPLNEECGLLEWVPNTCGLRNILSKMYKEKGLYVRSSELKRLYERMGSCKDSKERENVFNTQVLKRFPPIFHEWFLKTFSTPTSWYNSRLAYCRTAAVMSMVGHILGLGDRHGENILFDSTNGDCVHVDFNCLFNKGETFECPECVPFRLTHNMVRAMGPLGYEGIFRRSCEVTLKLMRSQHDSLLSVLKTFVYDPLVEWGVRKQTDTAGTSAAKEEGLKIVKQIDKRLLGYSARNKIQMPLSIEGEVFQLITDATDVDNLSRMYIGWAAHL